MDWLGSDIRERVVSSKERHVDMAYGCVWGCVGVVGYRLGGVSGKGIHRDVCVSDTKIEWREGP